MMQTELRQKGIDGANLYPSTAASISQLRGCDVIVASGNQQGHSRKPIQKLCAVRWAGKALQQLLQHKAGCKDRLARFDSLDQAPHFQAGRRRIAPECTRPNAGVDENAQSRMRSAL